MRFGSLYLYLGCIEIIAVEDFCHLEDIIASGFSLTLSFEHSDEFRSVILTMELFGQVLRPVVTNSVKADRLPTTSENDHRQRFDNIRVIVRGNLHIQVIEIPFFLRYNDENRGCCRTPFVKAFEN